MTTSSSTPTASNDNRHSSTIPSLASQHIENAATRREEDIHKSAKTQDPFAQTSRGLLDQIVEQKFAWMTGLGILLIGGAGLTALKSQRDAKIEKGRTALYSARKTYAEEMKGLEATLAPQSASQDSKAKKPATPPEAIDFQAFDVDAKLAQAVTALETVAKDFEGTLPGFEAMMALGGIYFDHGNSEKSRGWFEKAEKNAPGSRDRGFAALNVAYTFENTAQPELAIQWFQRSLQTNDEAYAADASFGIARNQIALGKGEKALEIYDSLISKHPNTEISKSAQTLKSLVK